MSIRVQLSHAERIINAMSRIKFKRTDSGIERDQKIADAINEIIKPLLVELRAARRVAAYATDMLQEHIDEFGHGQVSDWERVRNELGWGEGCTPLGLGDALVAYNKALEQS